MKISVINRQKIFSLSPASVRRVVRMVLDHENVEPDELAIYFVTKQEIAELHEKFFDDPTPTDCITFPLDQTAGLPHHLGEIFICPEIAVAYIQKNNGKCEEKDYYFETTLYLVHGLLHLLGYDDMEKEERKEMRKAEKKHMSNLLKSNVLIDPK